MQAKITKNASGIRVLHLARSTVAPKTFFTSEPKVVEAPKSTGALLPRTDKNPKPVKFTHTNADNLYHYVYTPATARREGVLKVRIPVDRMEQFRTSRFGSAVEELVDVLHQGNGWYEVTSKDLSNLTETSGVRHDGLIVWLREFNRFFVGNVKAVSAKAPVAVEKPRAQIRLVVNKQSKKIEAKQTAPVSSDRLALLVQTVNRRFGH